MVYHFVIVSDEVADFRRDIRIDSSATFLDFRNTILKATGYIADEPMIFRTADKSWTPKQDIYEVDMGFIRSDEDLFLMKDTILEELLEEEKDRLLLTFDLMGDRSLYIELRGIDNSETLSAPIITRSKGEAPRQHTSKDAILAGLLNTQSTIQTSSSPFSETESEIEGYNAEDLEDLDITSEEDY